MSRINTPIERPDVLTREGARAYPHLRTIAQLRRSVLSCLLWEDEFYEDGQSIADRIFETALDINPQAVAELAVEARTNFNLRHVPLILLCAIARTGKNSSLVSHTIPMVIQRADELCEFLAVYAKINGVTPDKLKSKLSNQVRKGLAYAFGKFDEYQLAKYNRDGAVKLRDVLFLCHAKPKNDQQGDLWKRLINGKLAPPDTWEVALASGANKRETFERLLREEKLGYLALLRNLRNMQEAECDTQLVRQAILDRKGAHRVLPFRYVAAARAAVSFEPELDQALCDSIAEMKALPGKTVVLVDVSGSMNEKISHKSDLTRIDAAAALASIIPGDLRVFTFSEELVEVPHRKGMAGVETIIASQPHHGTNLGAAISQIKAPHDRLIVITDEQSHDKVGPPSSKHAYMINVASERNGVGYGQWTHIDGFSEAVLRFIEEHESNLLHQQQGDNHV
jgi:hypothetical protein